MKSPVVCTFCSNINADFSSSDITAYYSIIMIFNLMRAGINNTFWWLVFIISHLFMLYTIIFHIYQIWPGFSISFHYFNNSFKSKTRCTKLFCFNFFHDYNHNGKTLLVTSFLLFFKAAFVYKLTMKSF